MKAVHSIRTSPQHERDDDCPVCDYSGGFVEYEGDRFCPICGYIPSPDGGVERPNPWDEWHSERRDDDYSGWHGEDRIKMVGGFIGPWDWGDDDYLA